MIIKKLSDTKTAEKIGAFLTDIDTFDQEWAPDEKRIVKQAPIDSISSENHQYWYAEDQGQIIGAIGVRENKYKSGGYEMDSDYMAIHKKYRKQGIATQLLIQAEEFVKEKNGRYIHILSCDIPSYKPARAFYEKHGYHQVATIPDYYVRGEGRVDYFKQFK